MIVTLFGGSGPGPVPVDIGAAVERARGLLPRRRTLLGITGPPGAGKSTLAETVATALGAQAVVVPMDGFHLADRSLEALGLLGFKGRADTFDACGYLALLTRLRRETAYCELDPTVRRDRLVARHVRFGKPAAVAAAWVDTVDEPNARLVATSRDKADRIVRMA